MNGLLTTHSGSRRALLAGADSRGGPRKAGEQGAVWECCWAAAFSLCVCSPVWLLSPWGSFRKQGACRLPQRGEFSGPGEVWALSFLRLPGGCSGSGAENEWRGGPSTRRVWAGGRGRSPWGVWRAPSPQGWAPRKCRGRRGEKGEGGRRVEVGGCRGKRGRRRKRGGGAGGAARPWLPSGAFQTSRTLISAPVLRGGAQEDLLSAPPAQNPGCFLTSGVLPFVFAS